MKRIFAISLILMLLGAGGYFAYGKYQHTRFVESLAPHVKNASLRVSNSARYETEEKTNITFKELFEKLEADIAEIDKRLIDIQSLSSPKTAAVTDPTVAYLRASQASLRALLQKYRKWLALTSAINWAQRSVDELRASTSYGFEFAKHSSDKAIRQVGQAEKEYNASLPDLLTAVNKLAAARSQVKPHFTEDALIPAAQLEAVAKKNSPKSAEPAEATRSARK